MNQTARRLAAFGGVVAIALGGAGAAQARQGADDPAGHVRHGRGADDVQPHARQGADDPAGHVRHRHHHRHHHAAGHR
ncbi:MAG: hypothetical protein QOJ07_156 [Thermoleophilaceae bacterium]|nr:hypothetical protein [Thermoleophilaceae bacterium]